MRGVNKVILIGNAGKDPELRSMPSGGGVANLTVATSENWKDKQTGEAKERTEWHNVVFYNKLAEIVGQYVKKGSQVYLEGSIRTRKWTDKEGHDRYTTEVVADTMLMLGGKPSGSGSAERPAARAAAPASDGAGRNFEDDDIPFAKRHWKEG